MNVGHRLRRIGRDLQFGNVVVCRQHELRVGRLWKGEAPLEILIEPEWPCDSELRCEPMVHVRSEEGSSDVLVRDQLAGAVSVIHDPVEIIGRSHPQQRRFNERSIRLEADGRIE